MSATKILKNSDEDPNLIRRKESQDSGLCEDFQCLKLATISKQNSQNDQQKHDYNQLSKSESQISQVSQASVSSFYSTQFRKNPVEKKSNYVYKKNGNNYQQNNNAFFYKSSKNLQQQQPLHLPQTFVPTQQVFPKDVKNPRIKYKRNDLLAIYWQMMSQIGTYATYQITENVSNDSNNENPENIGNTGNTGNRSITTFPVPVCGYNGYREIIAQLPRIVGVTCDLELIENQRKNRTNNKRNQGNNNNKRK